MDNQTVPSSGAMNKNTAAALSYVLGFITGLIFYLTSKDQFVRFHAMQSIIASLALIALSYVLSMIPGFWTLYPIINLAALALFIFLIVKAAKGEKFKLPLIGDFAEKKA